MSARFKVSLSGLPQAKAAFQRAPEAAQLRLGAASQTTAFQIAQRMRATAPRREGYLVAAIDSSFDSKTGVARAGARKDVIGDLGERPSHYAHLVEFGHGGPHPAPEHAFAIPAAEAERDPFLARCREAGSAIEVDLTSGGGLL